VFKLPHAEASGTHGLTLQSHDHRILRVPGEPYPDRAFKPSLPEPEFIHVNAVPGKPDSVPAASLLKAYRQELVRSHLEFKDYYFALLDRLSKSGSKDPFVLSHWRKKAGSDGDLPTSDSLRQAGD